MSLQAVPRRVLLAGRARSLATAAPARAGVAAAAAAVGFGAGLAPELVLLGVLCWVSVLVALAQQALP